MIILPPSLWTSLAVQWLGLCASTAGGMDSITGQGTKMLPASWHGHNNNSKIKRITVFHLFKKRQVWFPATSPSIL